MPEKKNIFPILLKVFLGLVFLISGLLAIAGFWEDFITILAGCLGPVLILVGVIFLAIAKD